MYFRTLSIYQTSESSLSKKEKLSKLVFFFEGSKREEKVTQTSTPLQKETQTSSPSSRLAAVEGNFTSPVFEIRKRKGQKRHYHPHE